MKQVDWEPVQDDLQGHVDILCSGRKTLDFRNELCSKIRKYIMKNMNQQKTKPKFPNPSPEHIRYSGNCDKAFVRRVK